ncbi:MAG: Crp/Fnr family transcriptional regulator [Aquabacterium sp.]|jgi:CRP-like cAMP-binding protein|nr:Crp/Fnr family transcriptional regulator [Aquabacterium sp.]
MHRRIDSSPAALLPALQSHLWFASCPPELQRALVDRGRLRHLKSGESLFARGDVQDGLCCVLAGALMIGSTSLHDGTHRLTLYVEPYHWFGEVALMDNLPRSQDAIAGTDSTVLVVTRAQIEPWLDAHPHYWRDIARLACSKLRLMLTALEDNATLPIDTQLARRLLFSVTNFGQATADTVRRRVRVPQEYMAKMLGVSRQTINKALRTLENEGVLALHYAEIEIVDLAALAKRAGPVDPGLIQGVSDLTEARPSSLNQ